MDSRSDYIETLKKEEKRLSAELDAIRNLISIAEGRSVNGSPSETLKKGKKEVVKGIGIPRGNLGWQEYTLVILKEIGGKGKTSDVVDYAIKANPKKTKQQLFTALRSKLSRLYRAEKIGANKGAIKSEGYEYFIKPDSGDFAKK